MVKNTILVVILAVALFVNCTNKGEANKAAQEATKNRERITNLESQLKLTQDTLSQSKSLQGQVVEVNEVLRHQNDSLVQTLEKQGANLALARLGIVSLLTQQDAIFALSDSAMLAKDLKIGNGQNSLRLAWDFADEVKSRLSSTETKLAQYQGWYRYYKPVAKRSIFKHLFGAGKPPQPTAPDPEN